MTEGRGETKRVLRAGACAAAICAAYLQTAGAQDGAVDEIVVTGTNIRSDQFQAVTPVDVYTEAEIESAGFSTVTDLVRNIPANYGSEANRQGFTQNNTIGTAQVNLRGLGLGSTLVLTNGRRNVLSATFANDGSQFVDINQLPLSLIERVEVVKTGASAIYGSDAVAGVVNFITRQDFRGVELDAQYQTTEASQEDLTLNLLAGFGNDETSMTFAATWFDRTELRFDDRDFTATGTEVELATSSPGSFVLLAPPQNPAFAGTPVGVPVADPNCAAAGGIVTTTPGGQFCAGETRDQFVFVPDEERLSLYGDLRHQGANGFGAFVEVLYADMEATATGGAPSLPGAGRSGSLIVAPTNQFNPFGAPAVFVGRPIGSNQATADVGATSETWRVAAGVSYDMEGGERVEASYVHAENDYSITFQDLLANEFFIPGTNTIRNDFNVFATAVTDPTQANDPALLDAVTTTVPYDFASTLDVVDASVAGTAFKTAAGPIGYALGVQLRANSASLDAAEGVNDPGEFVFLFPQDDFDSGTITATSVYGEAQVPLGDRIDVQAALRYESYSDGIGDTLDPKVAVTAELVEDLILRASAGTSFRAPTPLQTGGETVQVGPIVNPCTGQRAATAIQTSGNSELDPETATTYSAGVAYERRGGFRASVDYWAYDYEDVITRQSAEALVAGATCTQVAPGVFVPVADGINLNPATGQIAQVEVGFVNAGAIETDGFDLSVGYTADTDGYGAFSADLSGTWITTFDVAETPGGATVDRLGSRNVNSFVRPTPEVRGNLALGWEMGVHRVTGIVRYTDDYQDDLNAGAEIDSLTTLDVQYALNLAGLVGDGATQLRVGAINITDEDPPFVQDRGGYDPLVADPRGRLVYVGLTQGF